MMPAPGGMSRLQLDLVESLVFQVLETTKTEQEALAARLGAAHPDLAPILHRRLAALRDLRTFGGGEGEPPRQLGPFELLKRLGGGGMGMVWLARNGPLERLVALKLIRQDLLLHPATKERFRREMRLTAQLVHPNICTVYSAGEIDGTPYIEMQLLAGCTLAELIRRARGGNGRPPAETPPSGLLLTSTHASRAGLVPLLHLVEKVARALNAAHQAGLVHRDMKPGNILVTPEGEPMLLDFGLARKKEGEDESLTLTGEQPGTPAYMSPEQVTPGAPIDHRTDVYSLGVTLYECLTLHLPFAAPDRESLFRQIRQTPPPDPRRHRRGLPRELKAILETALDKNPDRRYATALDFAEDLRRLQELKPVLARRPSPLLRGRRWVQRNPMATAILAILSTALVVTVVLLARVDALSQSRRALALVGAAAAEERTNPGLSLLLALRAAETAPGPEVRQQLRSSLAASREVAVARGHELWLWGADFAPGGREFLTWSQDGTVRTWDLDGLEKTESRIVLGSPVMDVHLSPDGRRLLAGTGDGRVVLWDRRAGTHRELTRFPGRVTCVRFAPGGSRLAAAAIQGGARLFDGEGNPLPEMTGGAAQAVTGLAFPPAGGEMLATASTDRTARLWDLRREPWAAVPLTGHTGTVHWIGFSPDGKRILTASGDGTARLWDLDGRELALLRGHRDRLREAAWSPQGDRIATTSLDHTVRIWSAEGTLLDILRGHAGLVLRCAFSPDGEFLASGGDDDTIRLWDRNGRQAASLRGHQQQVLGGVRFSPDGRLLLSASADTTARLWAVSDTGLPTLRAHGPGVSFVRPVPGQERLLTMSQDGYIQYWDYAGREECSFPSGHGDLVTEFRVSPDGRSFLTADNGGVVKLWNLPGRSVLGTLPKAVGQILSIAFDTESDRFLTLEVETRAGCSHLRLWDRELGSSGEAAPDRFKASELASCALFLPGGKGFAVGLYNQGLILLVDPRGGELGRLEGHEGGLSYLALSPDGRYLLSASSDLTARIWDLRTLALAAPPLRHEKGVLGVAWSPDGQQVATGSRDGAARLWDRHGNLLDLLRFSEGRVLTADFLGDGKRLVAGSMDGTVRFWHRDPGEFLAFARTRVPRGFSFVELDRYPDLTGEWNGWYEALVGTAVSGRTGR